jgi:hypothetical protein
MVMFDCGTTRSVLAWACAALGPSKAAANAAAQSREREVTGSLQRRSTDCAPQRKQQVRPARDEAPGN